MPYILGALAILGFGAYAGVEADKKLNPPVPSGTINWPTLILVAGGAVVVIYGAKKLGVI